MAGLGWFRTPSQSRNRSSGGEEFKGWQLGVNQVLIKGVGVSVQVLGVPNEDDQFIRRVSPTPPALSNRLGNLVKRRGRVNAFMGGPHRNCSRPIMPQNRRHNSVQLVIFDHYSTLLTGRNIFIDLLSISLKQIKVLFALLLHNLNLFKFLKFLNFVSKVLKIY